MTHDELLTMVKRMLKHGAYMRSECGGGECFYCFGDFSNHLGTFKHASDCDYVAVCKLIGHEPD